MGRSTLTGQKMMKYRQEVLNELIGHGILPGPDTAVEFVRDYINELYLYEIRKLRSRMLAGEIPKKAYAGKVLELRKRYPILSIPMQFWVSREDEEGKDEGGEGGEEVKG